MLPIPLQRQLFSTKNYRTFIRKMIESQEGKRGYKKRLADCAGCQAAYLSQVLAEKAELTPEQAERLCQFWALSQLESEYFFQLVNLARAGTASLRERISLRLLEVKSEWQNKNSSFEKASVSEPDSAALYYCHWLHSAIHVLVTVPALATAAALAKHLQQSESVVKEALEDLRRIGLVVETEGRWRTTQGQIHAAQKDFFAELHHKNWRLKALEPRKGGKKIGIRYTSVHTISEADFLKLRDLLDEAIRNSRKLIEPSPEETGACLVIDYFPL